MARWWQDIRYSVASLRRRPGLALASIFSLAIGLGGALAIYATAQAILFRPLPFTDADRLVAVETMVQRDALELRALSVPDFLNFRGQATQHLETTAAWSSFTSTLRAGETGHRVNGEMVSGTYFRVLGISPIAGDLLPDRDVADAAPPLVLGETLWTRLYDRDPGVIGRTMIVDEVPFTIVGVVPVSMRGVGDQAEFWIPFAQHDALVTSGTWTNRGSRWHNAVARLRAGSSREAAEAELKGIADRLQRDYAGSNKGYTVRARTLRDFYFGQVRNQVVLLLIAVGVVLVMTCVNVANLLVARLSSRQFEFSVRSALGATRGRLVSLAAADGLVLSITGAIAGAPLTLWLVSALQQINPVTLPTFAEPAISWGVAATGLGLTLTAAAFIALTSILSIGAPASGLTEAARGSSDASRHVRLRRWLTVVQVAGAVALLTTATLLGLSFNNLMRIEPGFATDHRLATRFELPSVTYDEARRQVMRLTVLNEVSRVAGVAQAALSTDTMLNGAGSASFYVADVPAEADADREGRTYVHAVTHNFFDVAGIPILEGTTLPIFDGVEIDPAMVDLPVVVSAKLARRFWPAGTAVGQRVRFGRSASDRPWMRIVGVAGDTKYRGLPDNPTADPDVYVPLASRAATTVSLLVQTSVEPASLIQTLERTVRALDPQVPLYGTYVMADRVRDVTSPHRFLAQLSSAFGLVALLLAVVGTYGVVAYQVTLAQRSIGIRLALGATPRRILGDVLGGMARLLISGVVIGMVLIWYVSAGLRDQLYNVSPTSSPVLMFVVGTVTLVALLSAWLPARRAMRVNPVSVLRGDA